MLPNYYFVRYVNLFDSNVKDILVEFQSRVNLIELTATSVLNM